MYKCPHCNEPGISVLRKLCLGPAGSATCKHCKRKVGVPYSAILAITPLILMNFISWRIEAMALKVAAWIVAFIVTCTIHLKKVPLIPK